MSAMFEYTVIFSTPFWRGAAKGFNVSYQALTSKAYGAIVSRFKDAFGRRTYVASKHFTQDHSNTVAKRYGLDIEVRDRYGYSMNRNTRQRKAAAARVLATEIVDAIFKELRVKCKQRNK